VEFLGRESFHSTFEFALTVIGFAMFAAALHALDERVAALSELFAHESVEGAFVVFARSVLADGVLIAFLVLSVRAVVVGVAGVALATPMPPVMGMTDRLIPINHYARLIGTCA